ncbi:MAG: NAD-dependent epimerase/dehydratase family protein, partial [Candidatus Desantisbacteria bacterium]
AGKSEEAKGQYANLISQILWNLENDSVFQPYGTGNQTRDLTYTEDLARALWIIMQKATWEGTPAGSIAAFNIGLGKAYTLNKQILIIMNTLGLGSKSNIEYIPNPLADYVMFTLSNPDKLKGLGWQPAFSFPTSVDDILLNNELAYNRKVKQWEAEYPAVYLNPSGLKQMGFKNTLANLWERGPYFILLNQDNSLRGIYTQRQKVGPLEVTLYQGEVQYDAQKSPIKEPGMIEDILWQANPLDYQKKVIPLEYDSEKRSLVLLNAKHKISVARQLGWQVEGSEMNSEEFTGSILERLEAIKDKQGKPLFKEIGSGIYLTQDEGILLLYDQEEDNIKLVVAKPHVEVYSEVITNSTTIEEFIPNSEYGPLLRLQRADLCFSINQEGIFYDTEIVEERPKTEVGGVALVPLAYQEGIFTVFGKNDNSQIDSLITLTGYTISQIERFLRAGAPKQNFLGKEEGFKELLKKDNSSVLERDLTHQDLGGDLIYVIGLLDRVIGRGGAIGKPIHFRYKNQKFIASHVPSNRIGSPFMEYPQLPTRGLYKIKNLDTGKEVILQGLLAESIRRYGFYGGLGAARHFRVEPKDLMELFGYDLAKPRPGFTEEDVVKEATQIIRSGQVNNFRVIKIKDPMVQEVLRYYELTSQLDKARRLRRIVKAGRLRAGPLETGYGVNVKVDRRKWEFIATNANPNPTAVLVHENNQGTHKDNLKAEQEFIEYSRFKPLQLPPAKEIKLLPPAK